jgi:hypothetical protein
MMSEEMFETKQEHWNKMIAAINANQDVDVIQDFARLMQDYTKSQMLIKALDQALIEVGKRGSIEYSEVVSVLQSQYDQLENEFKDQLLDAQRKEASKIIT